MRRRRRPFTAAAGDTLPPPSPLDVALAQLQWERVGLVVSREAAMRNSVVNRSRDLLCGTLASLPFTRTDTAGAELPNGWLDRPDPDHTRAWLVASTTDDLFFNGYAFWRVTARDAETVPRPLAVQWMPFAQVTVTRDGVGRIVSARWTPPFGGGVLDVPAVDLIIFEGLSTGLLWSGRDVLSTAARLDNAANRYSGANMAAGWLKQTGGVPLNAAEATEFLRTFTDAREANVLAWLSETVDYHESTLDPSKLQLVEARTYQDGAVARLCNVPAYMVGVGIPNAPMTYQNAEQTRVDLITFGMAPYLTCWSQTLSANNVTPRGQTVAFDPSAFLALAASVPGATAPAPAQGAPAAP
jgi:phage portal protein BeeE